MRAAPLDELGLLCSHRQSRCNRRVDLAILRNGQLFRRRRQLTGGPVDGRQTVLASDFVGYR